MKQAADTKPGNYYVSVIRDGGDYRLLAGPFPNDHARALELVDKARAVAEKLDPKAVWYAYGTCRLDANVLTAPLGILNAQLGLILEPA